MRFNFLKVTIFKDWPVSFPRRSRDFLPRLADKTKSSSVHGGSSDGRKESSVSWSDI